MTASGEAGAPAVGFDPFAGPRPAGTAHARMDELRDGHARIPDYRIARRRTR
ncbi:hypothetical protein GWI34_07705 [Actinomadura sp. DSM 109109]|nr:hypothetical protein [Actinomadura lepetitiana]